MQRTCIKCGHVNTTATGLDSEACPACGVIYAKALPTSGKPVLQGAVQSGFGATASVLAAPPAAPWGGDSLAAVGEAGARFREAINGKSVAVKDANVQRFVRHMRDDSLYPTFRATINVGHGLGIVLALICLLGGLFGLFTSGIWAGAAGIGLAVLIWALSRLFKEASLMVADLCDAAVRMAASGNKP